MGPDGPPPTERDYEGRIATYETDDGDDGGAMVRKPRQPPPSKGSAGATSDRITARRPAGSAVIVDISMELVGRAAPPTACG
jgi:hypothetical protein